MGLEDKSRLRRLLRPMKILSGRIVNRLLAKLSESNRGVLANIVLSKCSMALKLRSSDRSEAATSVNADVGMATNSLKDKLTVSTMVAWKTSRGNDRSLKGSKF